MNLHDYTRVLRQGSWVLILLTLLGGAAGAAFAALATPTYQVTASIYISLVGSGSTSDLQQGNVFATQKAATYAELALSGPVLESAVDSLGDGTTVDELREAVSATPRGTTSLIDIFATGSNPEQVAAWANAVGTGLAEQIAALDAPVTVDEVTGVASTLPVTVDLVDPAETPETAVTPQPRYNILVGAVVGLFLGVGILVVRATFDTRIRSVADLPRAGEFASLTSIPGAGTRVGRGGQKDGRLESFRTLRANLQFGAQTGNCMAVAPVDSAGDATSVSRQLAQVLGEVGSRVLVVDLDLRQPAASRGRRGAVDRGDAQAGGVADVLRGELGLAEAVTSAGPDNVFFLSAGNVDRYSAQFLSTTRMKAILDRLKADYSYVVLACPPLVERSEAAVVAALADSTLVLVESASTRRASFLFALELLQGVRADSVSVVLENVRTGDLAARTRDASVSA